MENYNGVIGSITAAVLKCGLQPSTTIQLIVRQKFTFVYFIHSIFLVQAVDDIGHVAAAVFHVSV